MKERKDASSFAVERLGQIDWIERHKTGSEVGGEKKDIVVVGVNGLKKWEKGG